MPSSFLTVKELSQLLNIKGPTLYAWAKQCKIPCYKIHGLIRFRLKDILRWLKSFSRGEAKRLPRKLGSRDSGDLNALIARAQREAHNTLHGETRPKSSLTRKEDDDGAR